jgi:hypothetical protein
MSHTSTHGDSFYGNATTASRFSAVEPGPIRVVELSYVSPPSATQYYASAGSPLRTSLGPVGRVIE